jgi:hypothetical protein
VKACQKSLPLRLNSSDKLRGRVSARRAAKLNKKSYSWEKGKKTLFALGRISFARTAKFYANVAVWGNL